MTAKERIEAIKERVSKASPEPQEFDSSDGPYCETCNSFVQIPPDNKTDWFDDPICNSCLAEASDGFRKDIPWLIQEIEKRDRALQVATETLSEHEMPPYKDSCLKSLLENHSATSKYVLSKIQNILAGKGE